MPANTAPIFSIAPRTNWGATALATANTAMDGTGTVLTVFTAGTNGSYIDFISAKSAGTNIATVLRLFLNNGSSSATPANNILIKEFSLPAITASASAAQTDIIIPFAFAIPASYVINATVGTTVANGWYIAGIGGDY